MMGSGIEHRLFKLLTEKAPIEIYYTDANGNCTYVNPAWQKIAGLTYAEAIGSGWLQAIHPDDYGRVRDTWYRSTQAGLDYQDIIRFVTPAGTISWVKSQATADRDEEGHVVGYVGTLTDITEQHLAETALKQSDSQLRQVTEAIPGVVFQYEITASQCHSFRFVSSSAMRILGVPVPEILHDFQLFWSCFVPEAIPFLWSDLQYSCLHLTPINNRCRITHPKLGLKWIRFQAIPTRSEEGDTLWTGIIVDITDRYDIEEILQQIAALLPGALYKYHLGADGSQAMIYCSPGIYDLFEVSPLEAQEDYQRLWACILPEYSEGVYQSILTADTADSPWQYEFPIASVHSQTLKWIRGHSVPTRQEDGSSVWHGILQDITQEKYAEQTTRMSAILEKRERYLSSLVTIQQTLLSQRSSAYYTDILPYLGKASGASRVYLFENHRDATGKLFMTQRSEWCAEGIRSEIENPQLQNLSYQDFFPRWQEVLSRGQAINNTVVELPSSERSILEPQHILSILILPLRIGDEFWGFIGFDNCLDAVPWSALEVNLLTAAASAISLHHERQHIEQQRNQLIQVLESSNQQLQLANQDLARATRLKDEFLATMSHELRTPLNAVLGMAEILDDQIYGTLNDKQKQSVQTIERSGRHLLELINDILDLAKIEAGKMDLQRIPTSIYTLCASTLTFFSHQAQNKRIRLHLSVPENISPIMIDDRRIGQVIMNLLSNALKFTPADGEVQLTVTHHENYLCLKVIDSGIGIRAQDMPRLFKTFTQLDAGLNRQYGGTGLGLVMVKRIVELHGGAVGVESTWGKGSCFWITLPYQTPGETPSPPRILSPDTPNQSDYSPKDKTPLILLVEDHAMSTETVQNYLSAKHYRLLTATDGQTGVAFALEYKPDVILMDIQMPKMSGYEAIRIIRSQLTIPIIALTALALPQDREACLEAGANVYMAKPINLRSLDQTIQALLHHG